MKQYELIILEDTKTPMASYQWWVGSPWSMVPDHLRQVLRHACVYVRTTMDPDEEYRIHSTQLYAVFMEESEYLIAKMSM